MKKLVLLMSGLFVAVSCVAQYSAASRKENKNNDQSFDSKKIYFSMSGGLGFGSSNGVNYTYYSLLPTVGYRLTDQISLGSIITLQRYSYTNTPSGSSSYTQYGIGPFVRYTINPLFFQAEYDLISSPKINESIRANYSRMLFGVGYTFSSGKRASIGGLVMYDVLYRVPSVFASPIVTRVFVSF